MKKIWALALSLYLTVPLMAETPPTNQQIFTNATPTTTNADLAAKYPEISTFLLLVRTSQLNDLFDGTGPYTIFVPNNEAFNKYGKDKIDKLMKPENHDQLSDFVLYHFIPGKYSSKTLKTTALSTLEGKKVEITVENGQVKVNGAKVVRFDLEGKNGIIHVIDSVLLP
jgi:uncharacterized surface protein with fasciclin (FAS1) repeats